MIRYSGIKACALNHYEFLPLPMRNLQTCWIPVLVQPLGTLEL